MQTSQAIGLHLEYNKITSKNTYTYNTHTVYVHIYNNFKHL